MSAKTPPHKNRATSRSEKLPDQRTTGAPVEYETLLYSPYQPAHISDGGFQLSGSCRQFRGHRRDLGHFLNRICPQALLHVLTGGRLDEFVDPKQQY